MTCIIGLVHSGKVYMGCDSASVDDWTMRVTRLRKVFVRGEFIIGYTTSFRMGQIIQYMPPPEIVDYDPLEFLVTKFIPAVRAALKEGGYTKVENNTEEGGDFLIGFKGQLFRVASDFQVNQMEDNFDAIGIGFPFALGAIKTLLPMLESHDPGLIILKALETTAHFSKGVIGPYYTKVLE